MSSKSSSVHTFERIEQKSVCTRRREKKEDVCIQRETERERERERERNKQHTHTTHKKPHLAITGKSTIYQNFELSERPLLDKMESKFESLAEDSPSTKEERDDDDHNAMTANEKEEICLRNCIDPRR